MLKYPNKLSVTLVKDVICIQINSVSFTVVHELNFISSKRGKLPVQISWRVGTYGGHMKRGRTSSFPCEVSE